MSFDSDRSRAGVSVPTVRLIDADMFSGVLSILPLSEHVLRGLYSVIGGDAQRTAIGGLIEARLCSVNAFRPFQNRGSGRKEADKALMRLNFPRCTVNG
jgi:hypothetical protein